MSSPDRKRTSEESAATAVTPHKKKQRLELEEKGNEGNRISAESIMGFPKYPNLTNKEIVMTLLIGRRGKRRMEPLLEDY